MSLYIKNIKQPTALYSVSVQLYGQNRKYVYYTTWLENNRRKQSVI